jgi:hypothetical protein
MRRPHPRFDDARNAWVTRAGGALKILAKRPKNANTEAAAWDAFYVHMAKLGNPVVGSAIPVLTLGQIADKYGEWMRRETEAGRMKPRTLDYYRDQLQKFLNALGGHRPAFGVLPPRSGDVQNRLAFRAGRAAVVQLGGNDGLAA